MEHSIDSRFERPIAWFTVLWSSASLMLVCLTWRLWTATSSFPQVPLFRWLVHCPIIVDWLLLAGMAAGCIALLFHSANQLLKRSQAPTENKDQTHGFDTRRRWAAIVFAATLMGLFLLNQHRLQPWAWQFFLYGLIIVVVNRPNVGPGTNNHVEPTESGDGQGLRNVVTAARWFTASIYFHSAVGKFDYQFLHGLGKRLAETGMGLVGVQPAGWLNQIAVAMPMFELLIAICLVTSVLRKWGIAMAIIFHGTLLATLGPWGLGHHTGVLVWNLFFMLITIVLFWPLQNRPSVSPIHKERADLRTIILTIVLVSYPLVPSCDHWLAWGLYSPNNSRADLEVIRQDKSGVSRFERFDLGGQSLQQLNVPLYPEARFQLGVATGLEQSGQLKTPSRIIVRSRSDRFSGERSSYEFKPETWQQDPTEFLLNWRPRSNR